ncbi:MAG: RagB/SusD family nutrient uptake outer membrane protein [Bacteroidales bacterium]|nr:RagB/SusD family nutrient uptake outer membrane protein [Bacteroidales bacterium]
MKRFLTILLVCLPLTGCLNKYLDRSPDAGLTEREVFSKYENFQKYFYNVYYGTYSIKCHYPLIWTGNINKLSLEALTDMCDMARYQLSQPAKMGQPSEVLFQTVGYNTSWYLGKIENTWRCIRICNKVIENIGMLQAEQYQKEDFLGQAYFVRAFCHLEIFRIYGAVPYVDKVLGPEDEWDIPSADDHEFLLQTAADFQTAADHFKAAGLMRRDPSSGAGTLDDVHQDLPNGVAALAMKGRALLYDASPLTNPTGDVFRWEAAAKASWEALEAALDNGYSLLDMSHFSDNFYGVRYTNEQLWAYNNGTDYHYKNNIFACTLNKFFSSDSYASGNCPTQNFVDKFETLGGYPLDTEEDRAAATAAGEYNEQNPFVNRDPRFEATVIYNQKELKGYGPAPIYNNSDGSIPVGSMIKKTAGYTDGVSETYYYENKRLGPLSEKGQQRLIITDPIIRLAEVYLNYAEAANEAYGPSTPAEGASLSALQALQVVRDRAGLPAPQARFTSSTEALRPRIKNERTVELCFEGAHYYCDIRRWKDAPEIGRSTLYGMRCTKLDPPYDTVLYPTGFRYERFPLPANRQISWSGDGMYWMQLRRTDLVKMKNYSQKPTW